MGYWQGCKYSPPNQERFDQNWVGWRDLKQPWKHISNKSDEFKWSISNMRIEKWGLEYSQIYVDMTNILLRLLLQTLQWYESIIGWRQKTPHFCLLNKSKWWLKLALTSSKNPSLSVWDLALWCVFWKLLATSSADILMGELATGEWSVSSPCWSTSVDASSYSRRSAVLIASTYGVQ